MMKTKTKIRAGLCYSYYYYDSLGQRQGTNTETDYTLGYKKNICERDHGGNWWTAAKKCCF